MVNIENLIKHIYREVGVALIQEVLDHLIGKDITIVIGETQISGKIHKVNDEYVIYFKIERRVPSAEKE